MKRVVVDCSIFVKLFVPEEGSDKAIKWCRDLREKRCEAWAPQLVIAEFANVILQKVRRGEVRRSDGRGCIKDFIKLPFNIVDHRGLVAGAFNLAIEYELAVYDALYASLAYKLSAPLVTADRRLAARLKDSPVVCEELL